MTLNLYIVHGDPMWPVCDAFALVACQNEKEALAMVEKIILKAMDPELIGTTERYDAPETIMYANGDY